MPWHWHPLAGTHTRTRMIPCCASSTDETFEQKSEEEGGRCSFLVKRETWGLSSPPWSLDGVQAAEASAVSHRVMLSRVAWAKV